MTTKFLAISQSVQLSETIFDRLPAVFEAAIEVTNALHTMRTGYSTDKWDELIEENDLLRDLVDATTDMEDAIESLSRTEQKNA